MTSRDARNSRGIPPGDRRRVFRLASASRIPSRHATHSCSDFAARLPNFSHAACDGIGSARVPRIPRVVFPVLLSGSIDRTGDVNAEANSRNPTGDEPGRENVLQNAIETNASD